MADAAYEVQTVDRLIAVLNQGDEGAEATRLYRSIMDTLAAYVADHGGEHKAELKISVKFKADAKGVDVSISSDAKLPKKPITKERFFMSDKNTLTLKDPGHDSLFPGTDMGRAKRPAAE